MELSSEKYVYKQFDTLTNKHLEDKDFLKANPTLDIPLITENHYSIISGPMQYVNYLITTRENVKRMLYSSESKVEIDRNIQHFTSKMRPFTGKIIRMLTTRLLEDYKVLNNSKISKVPKEMQERMSLSSVRNSNQVPERAAIKREIDMHLTKLLEHLNQHLGQNLYFGDTKRISVDDLMYFNEIQTI